MDWSYLQTLSFKVNSINSPFIIKMHKSWVDKLFKEFTEPTLIGLYALIKQLEDNLRIFLSSSQFDFSAILLIATPPNICQIKP